MSKGPNHRRGEERRQDNGPTWESSTPAAGCNSTHVARARRAWKVLGRRAERRTGERTSSVRHAGHPPAPLDIAQEVEPGRDQEDDQDA